MYLEITSPRVKKGILVMSSKDSGRSCNVQLGWTELKTGDQTTQHLRV